jgi:hypothetical protein
MSAAASCGSWGLVTLDGLPIVTPAHPTLDEYGMMGPNVIAIVGENPSRYAILMDASDLIPLQTFDELWASD